MSDKHEALNVLSKQTSSAKMLTMATVNIRMI